MPQPFRLAIGQVAQLGRILREIVELWTGAADEFPVFADEAALRRPMVFEEWDIGFRITGAGWQLLSPQRSLQAACLLFLSDLQPEAVLQHRQQLDQRDGLADPMSRLAERWM